MTSEEVWASIQQTASLSKNQDLLMIEVFELVFPEEALQTDLRGNYYAYPRTVLKDDRAAPGT